MIKGTLSERVLDTFPVIKIYQGKVNSRSRKRCQCHCQQVWDDDEPEMMLEKTTIESSWWAFCQLKKGFWTFRKKQQVFKGFKSIYVTKEHIRDRKRYWPQHNNFKKRKSENIFLKSWKSYSCIKVCVNLNSRKEWTLSKWSGTGAGKNI